MAPRLHLFDLWADEIARSGAQKNRAPASGGGPGQSNQKQQVNPAWQVISVVLAAKIINGQQAFDQ